MSKAAGLRMNKAAPRANFINLPMACHAGMIGERDAIENALEKFFEGKEDAMAFNRERVYEATGIVSPADTPPKDVYGQSIE